MYVMHTSGQLFWEFYNVNTLLLHVHVQLQLSIFFYVVYLYIVQYLYDSSYTVIYQECSLTTVLCFILFSNQAN